MRLDTGIKRSYAPMSPIELLSKFTAKLERFIRSFKGHKRFSAPRLPRELKLNSRERSDKLVHLASGINRDSAPIGVIF